MYSPDNAPKCTVSVDPMALHGILAAAGKVVGLRRGERKTRTQIELTRPRTFIHLSLSREQIGTREIEGSDFLAFFFFFFTKNSDVSSRKIRRKFIVGSRFAALPGFGIAV